MAAFYDPKGNQTAVASELKRLGWTDLMISGMLGRASRESSFNMSIANPNDAGPGKDSKGLFQWNRSRLAGLLKFAKQEGLKWNDPVAQARYTHYELTGKNRKLEEGETASGTESATWRRLNKAKSLTDSVNAAMLYTRPKGSVINGKLSPTTGLHYKETLAAARKIYGKPISSESPLDQIQSEWDPAATSKTQSIWDQSTKQSNAKIDFAAQSATEQGIIDAQNEIAATDNVAPNDGSFNPDLAGAIKGLFSPTSTTKTPTPTAPSLSELQQTFAPRLQWASL